MKILTQGQNPWSTLHNLDLKEGEESLAKHGDGGDDEDALMEAMDGWFAWGKKIKV